jgi:uncharacterized protein with PQ loop repeat
MINFKFFVIELQRQVMKTKSVEYMPFYLSFFSFAASTLWLLYGLLGRDLFLAVLQLSTHNTTFLLGKWLDQVQKDILLLACRHIMKQEKKSMKSRTKLCFRPYSSQCLFKN